MENGRAVWNSMLLVFLAGGVAGAGAGLLLAPQSGSATRDVMRRKLSDTGRYARGVRDRALRQSEDFRERAARQLTKVAAAISPGDRHGQEGASA